MPNDQITNSRLEMQLTKINLPPIASLPPEPKCDEPSNWVHRMVRQFEEAMQTAKDKKYLVDLTKEEAAAICFFAGVGYSVTLDGLTFEPCSLANRNGLWTAYVRSHA